MYTGLQHAHSGLAYLALLAIILVILWSLVGALSGREFQEKDRKIALIAFILCHIQLLVGLILYFVSPLGYSLLSGGGAMADRPQNCIDRIYPVSHTITCRLDSVLRQPSRLFLAFWWWCHGRCYCSFDRIRTPGDQYSCNCIDFCRLYPRQEIGKFQSQVPKHLHAICRWLSFDFEPNPLGKLDRKLIELNPSIFLKSSLVLDFFLRFSSNPSLVTAHL